jgi:ribosomal protein S18 acetylase RimI-like enzyme
MLPILPQSARPEDLSPAFRLLLAHLPEPEREQRLANFLWLVQTGEIDPRGVMIVPGADGPAGVIVCIPTSGASGMIWPPVCRPGPLRGLQEDALIHHACDWLRNQGVRVVQGLLGVDETDLGRSLDRNGIRHITSLWSLRHNLQLPLEWLRLPARLTFEPYREDDPDLFHATLQRTYEETLDCPEVSGARTIEQVIEGHKNQGLFDPELWWLVRQGPRPVGVLLMMPSPEGLDWELAYLGLVPEARGQGLGKELILKALCEARAALVSGVTLSVDERNHPARRLYLRAGFTPFDRRAVYLCVWR